jgi:hypothetical protein
LVQAGNGFLYSAVHKRINSILNKEIFPRERNGFINLLVYEKGDKTNHSNFLEISLLPTTQKLHQISFSQGQGDEITG